MGLPELRAQRGIELPGRVWWDAPRQVRDIDSAKQIFATEQYGPVVKLDDTLWILGEGCALCSYHRFARSYNYAYKVKPGSGDNRIVSF